MVVIRYSNISHLKFLSCCQKKNKGTNFQCTLPFWEHPKQKISFILHFMTLWPFLVFTQILVGYPFSKRFSQTLTKQLYIELPWHYPKSFLILAFDIVFVNSTNPQILRRQCCLGYLLSPQYKKWFLSSSNSFNL